MSTFLLDQTSRNIRIGRDSNADSSTQRVQSQLPKLALTAVPSLVTPQEGSFAFDSLTRRTYYGGYLPGTTVLAWIANDSTLQGRPVSPTAPVAGRALIWDGTQWISGLVQSGGLAPPVGPSVGTFGNSTNVAQFTYNAQGQILSAVNVPIAFPVISTNILSWSYDYTGPPIPVLPVTVPLGNWTQVYTGTGGAIPLIPGGPTLPAASTFVVPATGAYMVIMQVQIAAGPANFAININGVGTSIAAIPVGGTHVCHLVRNLTAGDLIWLSSPSFVTSISSGTGIHQFTIQRIA
jgi:hypothetical protein